MKVLLLDLGVGNLCSLRSAFARAGLAVGSARDARDLDGYEPLVLPGVGAFGAACERLTPLRERLRRELEGGRPCLAICLGMQLLFDTSDEAAGRALGLLPGRVRRLEARRRPHMGWNRLLTRPDPLFAGLEHPYVYFAHGFVVPPTPAAIAWAETDGVRFCAAVRVGRVWGTQFHPEKSGPAGARMIANFARAAFAPTVATHVEVGPAPRGRR